MASIRRRKRARGDVWVVDYRDGAGQRRLVTCRTKEQAELVAAQKVILSRQSSGVPAVDANIRVDEYSKRWLTLIKGTLKPNSLIMYESMFRVHLLPTIGFRRVREVQQGHLRLLLAEKLEANVSKSVIRSILAVAQSLFNTAIDDSLIAINPAAGVRRKLRLREDHLEEPEDAKGLTEAQQDRFLAVAAGSEHYPLFFLMVRAGLRLGEALALQWRDVDLTTRELRVRRTISVVRKLPTVVEGAGAGVLAPDVAGRRRDWQIGIPKSGKVRSVDVSAALAEVLRHRLTSARADNMRMGRCETEDAWVFADGSGRPLREARVQYAFRQAIKAAGLPKHFTPHALRHTFAIRLLEKGTPPNYVQKQMGHASIQMTVDVYGRWLPTGDKRLIDRLDEVAESRVAVGGDSERGRDQLVTSPRFAALRVPQPTDFIGLGSLREEKSRIMGSLQCRRDEPTSETERGDGAPRVERDAGGQGPPDHKCGV